MDSQEFKIRLQVAQKKDFFTHSLIFSVVFLFCVLLWLSMGLGPFWPMWIFAGFSLTLILEAVRLGSLPFLTKFFVFLTPEWEESEVQRLLQDGTNKNQ